MPSARRPQWRFCGNSSGAASDDLTVIDSGLSLDLLIAAGCVCKVVSYHAGGGFGVAVALSLRRAVEQGEIEMWECEEGILATGLQAAAQSLPFCLGAAAWARCRRSVPT